jgi:hypothetical protein
MHVEAEDLREVIERRKKKEAAAEERALEAEKAVKRLEYEAKMVELDRKQVGTPRSDYSGDEVHYMRC